MTKETIEMERRKGFLGYGVAGDINLNVMLVTLRSPKKNKVGNRIAKKRTLGSNPGRECEPKLVKYLHHTVLFAICLTLRH